MYLHLYLYLHFYNTKAYNKYYSAVFMPMTLAMLSLFGEVTPDEVDPRENLVWCNIGWDKVTKEQNIKLNKN